MQKYWSAYVLTSGQIIKKKQFYATVLIYSKNNEICLLFFFIYFCSFFALKLLQFLFSIILNRSNSFIKWNDEHILLKTHKLPMHQIVYIACYIKSFEFVLIFHFVVCNFFFFWQFSKFITFEFCWANRIYRSVLLHQYINKLIVCNTMVSLLW